MIANDADQSAKADLDRLRQRRIRRGVVLPFTVALVVVMGFGAAAFALPSPVQVAALSDAALTLLLLCPMVVCLFPLVVGAMTLVVMMARWNRKAASPLRRLESWAEALERNADGWLGGIDRRVLEWAVAFAPIRQLLRTFDIMIDEAVDRDES